MKKRYKFLIGFGIIIVLAFIVMNIVFKLIEPDAEFQSTRGVFFIGNFSLDEQMMVYGVLSNINPIYEIPSKDIHFVKRDDWDVCKYCSGCDGSCIGSNWRNGKEIYILYTGNLFGMRQTYCHELLHSIIKLDSKIPSRFDSKINKTVSLEEDIVDDLEDKFVCFEKNSN